MDKLKPCPFCGGEAHLDKVYSYFRDIVIYCEGCDTVFTLDDCDTTEEDVVNAWNRRSNTYRKWREKTYRKCGDCADFDKCKEYVEPSETFPEVRGGCKAFKAKGEKNE